MARPGRPCSRSAFCGRLSRSSPASSACTSRRSGLAPRMPESRPPSFIVLGAGPAGLAAAYKLSQAGWHDVTVLERGAQAGGNAGSFVLDGIPVDFGSHRLHPVTPPAVMSDIRAL